MAKNMMYTAVKVNHVVDPILAEHLNKIFLGLREQGYRVIISYESPDSAAVFEEHNSSETYYAVLFEQEKRNAVWDYINGAINPIDATQYKENEQLVYQEIKGNMNKQEQTFGQKAVGLSFNPSAENQVDVIKNQYAQMIDTLHDLREVSTDPEEKRMYSVAITEAQTSQMWAVKAATWKFNK